MKTLIILSNHKINNYHTHY